MSKHAITPKEIQAAADALAEDIVRTSCSFSRTLSTITGVSIFIKSEIEQFTASFKERGALNKLRGLSAAAAKRGVVAMSAGNHALALAYHARRLHIPATLVMPLATPTVKAEDTRRFGATVVLKGQSLSDAAAHARELENELGLTFVHPYDDLDVIRGQGTIAIEMLDQQKDLEILVVPIGGGGLIAGMAIAAKSINPSIRIIGVEAERYASMKQALAGEPIVCGSSTLAEGIAVKEPGAFTLPIVRDLVDEIQLVTEEHLERAMLMLLEIEKTVVEGAGAAGLAAVLAHPATYANKRTGIVLTGGNVDLMPLAFIMHRGLVRAGRLVRLRVSVPDRPGALHQVTRCLDRTNVNIVEVYHQRAFSGLPLQTTQIEFVLLTHGRAHLDELLAVLLHEGYEPEIL